MNLRQDEDGVWIAKSDLLPGCHAHGADRKQAAQRFQQAAESHLRALKKINLHSKGKGRSRQTVN